MRTIWEKAFGILDGTLLPIDRTAADTPYYSGKHKRYGMNVQVLTDPFGRLLWASPALPGSTHDLTAARQQGIIGALIEAAADWMPPAPEAQCRYVGEWVATKLRWGLTADDRELEVLKVYAEGPCEDTIVRYAPAA